MKGASDGVKHRVDGFPIAGCALRVRLAGKVRNDGEVVLR